MKRLDILFFAAATLQILGLVAIGQAANFTWDANGVFGDGNQDGGGTWSTANANWNNGAADVVWPNASVNDDAIIGVGSGAAGTIAVSGTVNDITFDAPGSGNYTIGGTTLTLVGGTTPTITANANATISAPLGGTVGMTKAGAGLLTLTATNSYSGATMINGGVLQIGNGTNVGAINNSTNVTINALGTLRWFRNDSGVEVQPTNNHSGAGTFHFLGTNSSVNLLQSRYTLTGQNNTSLSGTIIAEKARVVGTQADDFGTATLRVDNGGQFFFSSTPSFANNVIVNESTGWYESGGLNLGALRYAGTVNHSGHIQLNQPNAVALGDNSGQNSAITAYSASNVTLSGVISGTGELSMNRLNSWNGGSPQTTNIKLTGTSSNTYTGKTIVNGQGAVANLNLMKTGGAVAIAPNTIVQMGNNTGGQANLRMGDDQNTGATVGAARSAWDNQFGAGVQMNFVNASGQWMRFDLQGTNQTLAGIDAGTLATQAGAVIQNQNVQNFDPGQNATLTLNGSGTYLYNGYIRDQDNGGTTRKLALTWSGSGQQTLVGGAINYTGATIVTAGTLTLNNVTAWNSNITNNATVEFAATSPWALNASTNTTLAGSGTYKKTGGARLQLYIDTITATGQFLVEGGTLSNDGNSTNWTSSTADIALTNNSILDLYADAIFVDQLTGTAGTFVQNNYGNAAGQSGSSAFIEKLVVGVANGSSTFNGVVRNNSAGTAPAAATAGGGIQLEKTGTGSFTLAGANTYSGGSTVSQATLRTTHTTGFGTGAVTMGDTNTGTNNIQLTLAANNIANNITVSSNGTGTATILGETQFHGHTGTIALNRTTTFQTPNQGSGTDWWYSFGGGGISGSGPVIIKGGDGAPAGTTGAGNRVIFGGNNTYSGGTTIESGMLQLNSLTGAGTGSITLGNANSGSAVTQLRVGANITNNIIVSSTAPSSVASIGSFNALQILSGGLQVDRPVTINGGGDRLTWSGSSAVWSGAGDITISGGRVTHDTAVNTWTGNLIINPSSTFQIGNPGSALANASSVTASGALRLALSPGGSATIPRLEGAATGAIFANSGGAGAGTRTLLVGAGNGNGTFAGTIGPGTAGGEILAVTKIGSGTQIFNGNNTYAGATNVNAGTLIIGTTPATTTTGQGLYTVASGARLGGDGTIGANVNVVGTPGAISPGAANLPYPTTTPGGSYAGHSFDATYTAGQDMTGATVGTLTVNGNVDLDGYLLIDLISPALHDQFDVNGELDIGVESANNNHILEINGETDFTQLDFWGDLGFAFGDRVNLATAGDIDGNFFNTLSIVNQEFIDAGGRNMFFGNDGLAIYLQAVPEPVSFKLWLAFGSIGALVMWRRARSA